MTSNKKYDDLIRALVPRQPTGPQPGHHPAGQPQQPMMVYPPGQPYQPGPYYMGNAPIQYPPQYRMEPPYMPEPVEPWPPMPPNPPRYPPPRKSGPSGLDLAVVIFVAAMALIFLAAALPN